jgi:hypothetical protein
MEDRRWKMEATAKTNKTFKLLHIANQICKIEEGRNYKDGKRRRDNLAVNGR